jgi:signal transduction histidine kinase
LDALTRRYPILYSLRTKLVAPYAILTLIIALLGVYVITRLVSSSYEERFSNQMVEANIVAADGIVRQEQKQLSAARLLANMQGIPTAIEMQAQELLVPLFHGVALNDRIEMIGALDRSGRALLAISHDIESGEVETFSGDDFSRIEPVAMVMQGIVDEQGDKFVGLTDSQWGPILITTAPILDENGALQGVLFIGTRLKTFLAELKGQALADVVILDEQGKMISTTLVEPELGYGKLELGPLSAQGESFQSTSVSLELYGRAYEGIYSPLNLRGESTGYLGVIVPSDYVLNFISTSRNTVSLIFTLGTMAVIVLGYILAQHIARPILRLRAISQAVAGGDLEQSSGLDRSDEIGELANAFDIMTLRLRERTEEAARLYSETVQRNKQLADINARLQAAQAQLVQSEKLAAVGQLTAGIVHDVKNPLAVIKGLAEELAEETDADEFTRQGLQTIRESASRANAIVTDLLKFARQSTPEMQRRDLRDTLESVYRLTEYLLRKGKIELISELPDHPVMTTYDSQQIEQVIINLVTNAVQAMPDGGELRVRLSEDETKARIDVQDSGIGIPQENLLKIFDPFFTTKPEGEGTGLGLSVSYGIISEHGGSITVESEQGVGTTFHVILPLRKHENEQVEPKKKKKYAAHSGR